MKFFPKRTIHLDFHTGPQITDVGVDFDPDRFAQTFVDAHVDSVTVFAKCHHGLLYYDTDRPERHPGLSPSLNLLREQIDALHKVGIRAPIYLSVQVDEYAAAEHPEWVAQDADGRLVRWVEGGKTGGNPYEAGWYILDMSTPYQDYLVDQVSDLLTHVGEVDGLFLDMCWDQESSTNATKAATQAAGLDPMRPADRSAFARSKALAYMERFRDLVRPHLARDVASSVWFNSRPKTNIHDEGKLLSHVEVESLPTGGWGYAYLPYVARFVRPLGLPTLSHTGRFHRSWGDNASLKPQAALDYETRQILSYGLTNGVGDLLHPRGALTPAVYDRIGAAYGHVEACEPFLEGTTPVAQLALVVDPTLGDHPGAAGIGAVKMLQQLRHQFDIVAPDADLTDYEAVIVPETTPVDQDVAQRLSAYVAGGGGLLMVGASLVGEDGAASVPETGLSEIRPADHAVTFLRSVEESMPDLGQDVVVYDHGLTATLATDTDLLVETVDPYFDRTWEHFAGHSYTAPDRPSGQAAVARRGRVFSVTQPLFHTYGRFGNEAHRLIMEAVLDQLVPEPRVRVGGPVHLEAVVHESADTTVVSLLSYLPTRVGSGLGGDIDLVYDPFPLVDVAVDVRCPAPPTNLTLQPSGDPVDFTWQDGVAHASVTVLDGHALLVLDHPGDRS